MDETSISSGSDRQSIGPVIGIVIIIIILLLGGLYIFLNKLTPTEPAEVVNQITITETATTTTEESVASTSPASTTPKH